LKLTAESPYKLGALVHSVDEQIGRRQLSERNHFLFIRHHNPPGQTTGESGLAGHLRRTVRGFVAYDCHDKCVGTDTWASRALTVIARLVN
jgi:hypothetical protein